MCSFAAVRNKGLIIVSLWVLSHHLQAQILDDSSKLVYGPKTTLEFSQSGWENNRQDTVNVDTSLYEIEKFAFTDKLQGTYQNLGNIGTALGPLYYHAPKVSGIRTGYSAYDPLVHNPGTFRYFDTKSPFIDLKVVLGGQGRSLIDVLYTQNVTPNWNIGLEINRLNIDKQLGAVQNEGDRNLESSQISLFTQYQHPKRPYKLLGYLNQFNHQVREIGGIYYTDESEDTEIYQYRDASLLLSEATATDIRQDVHLFQSYGFFEFFQLYHQFDYSRQRFTYLDYTDGAGSTYNTYLDFYPNFFVDEDSTFQSFDFKSLQNEIGLKGGSQSVFYKFYARHRRVGYEWLYLQSTDPVNELYVGGMTRFNWKEIFAVQAQGELMNTGDYQLEGKLTSELISVRYRSQLYQPTLLERRYFGNHFDWDNNFNSTFANQLDGEISLKLGRFFITPEASFTSLSNYIYYDTTATPTPTDNALIIGKVGTSIDFELSTSQEFDEGFKFETSGYFNQVAGNEQEVYPIPQWLVNARWYWEGKWFENAVPMQLGFNFHFKSGYYGRAYHPSIQQFAVQNNDFLEGYFTIDPFVSMRVNNVFVFAKMTHVNMPIVGGYFITPRYLGQERIFDFGVRWLFFD
jgi:hypothetical protein